MHELLRRGAWVAWVLAGAVPVAARGALPRVASQERGAARPAAPREAKAAPRPVTSLVVTVSDPAGTPVAGALVMAIPSEGAYSAGGLLAEKTRSAVTSQDGRAKLEALPPGPWTVDVYAHGFWAEPQRRVAAGPLAVRLAKGGAISGVVRESDGLAPIAGARVMVANALPGDWQEALARNETTTDARGRFRLEGIGRTPVRLIARAPGFGRTERASVRAGARVELFLPSGATLSGTVQDEAGRPVKGALVRAEGDRPWDALPAERSDAQGGFEIAGVTPGEYTVVAREGWRAPGIATAVVTADAEVRVALTLTAGGFATGRIVDSDRAPLPGRVQVAALDGHGLPESAARSLAAQAKADGRFTLGPLPLGTLGLDAIAVGHVPQRVTIEITSRVRAVDLGEIALERGLSLRGSVRDRGGDAVAGAQVHAQGGRGEQSAGDASTDERGSFAIAGLQAGRFAVMATAPGYARATANGEAGGAPIHLVLDVAGEIVGRVVDESGRAVDDARVQAERASEESPGRTLYWASEEGDGRFALRDVAPGTYSLQAQAEGRGETSVGGVRVVAGRTVDVGTMTLTPGGVVVGTVVDGEGRGIPGATVSANRDVHRTSGRYQTQSGSTGAFEIRGVPIGAVSVTAQHPSYAEGTAVTAQVDPEKEPVPVRLVLARGGTIEGRAVHRDGRPFSEGRVSFHSLEQGRPGMRFQTAGIEADGSFVVDHVPPGRTMLMLMAFTPTSPMASGGIGTVLTSVASQEVDVADGETSTVEIVLRDVVVSGRVTNGGQPAPGVMVGVMPGRGASVMMWGGPAVASATGTGGGPPLLNGVSRDDGSYELVVLAPGPAFVRLRSASQEYRSRSVEIPDAERFQLDLEVGAASVAGIVVDRESGVPVADAAIALRHTDGDKAYGGSASCGPDGRFSIAADPGEYSLTARAPGRQGASLPVSVGQAGVSGLRVEMERGFAIEGRLVDAAGRPASDFEVLATSPEDRIGGRASSLPDGTFRIGGLGQRPYALLGGSDVAGFGFLNGVTPGGEAVTLVIRPAGRIVVRVVDEAGAPVADAYPRIDAIDGVPVDVPQSYGPTGADGVRTLASPPGNVALVASSGKKKGTAAVAVSAGRTASATITLAAPAP